MSDGFVVGLSLGEAVGFAVGLVVVLALGVDVGRVVGSAVGPVDGMGVGTDANANWIKVVTGEDLLLVCPMPSCPKSLLPQHTRLAF